MLCVIISGYRESSIRAAVDVGVSMEEVVSLLVREMRNIEDPAKKAVYKKVMRVALKVKGKVVQ